MTTRISEAIDANPNPAPDATLPDGCTCTMIGEGRAHGTLAFWINADCPLHGPKPDREDPAHEAARLNGQHKGRAA